MMANDLRRMQNSLWAAGLPSKKQEILYFSEKEGGLNATVKESFKVFVVLGQGWDM
jgi:hypothetical protein